jgi:NAD(P)-dependent dehydrogenase (short-subunit alcohol dehydrogenase family)
MELEGKVAVITGGASGIGRGMANRFAAAGMKLVLADVEEQALARAAAELTEAGADVHALRTDVSRRSDVDALAEAATARFGRVHVLCNNAGVSGGDNRDGIWATTDNDWAWVLGVNLMGVVHGLQAFVPRMLEHGEEGHVVNTSSVLGVWTGGGSIYGVTKHAVARLTEGLYVDLQARGARIGVSLLMPGLVATRIVSAARNRPEALKNAVDPALAARGEQLRAQVQAYFDAQGMPPDQVGDIVVDAIRARRFYVFTHPGSEGPVRERMQRILDGESPAPGSQLGLLTRSFVQREDD